MKGSSAVAVLTPGVSYDPRMALTLVVGYLVLGVLFEGFLLRVRAVTLTAEIPASWTQDQRDALAKFRSQDGWNGTGVLTVMMAGSMIITLPFWPILIGAIGLKTEERPWRGRGRIFVAFKGKLPENTFAVVADPTDVAL